MTALRAKGQTHSIPTEHVKAFTHGTITDIHAESIKFAGVIARYIGRGLSVNIQWEDGDDAGLSRRNMLQKLEQALMAYPNSYVTATLQEVFNFSVKRAPRILPHLGGTCHISITFHNRQGPSLEMVQKKQICETLRASSSAVMRGSTGRLDENVLEEEAKEILFQAMAPQTDGFKDPFDKYRINCCMGAILNSRSEFHSLEGLSLAFYNFSESKRIGEVAIAIPFCQPLQSLRGHIGVMYGVVYEYDEITPITNKRWFGEVFGVKPVEPGTLPKETYYRVVTSGV